MVGSVVVPAPLVFTAVVVAELVTIVDGVTLELGEVPTPIDVSVVSETAWCVVEGDVLELVEPAGDVPSLEHAGSIQAKANVAPNHTRGACA
jgi:hypothetical protein